MFNVSETKINSLSGINVSSFDAVPETMPVSKRFTNLDNIEIPLELPHGVDVHVMGVVCKDGTRLRKEEFEYVHENNVLRIHLQRVCTGVVLAQLIKI